MTALPYLHRIPVAVSSDAWVEIAFEQLKAWAKDEIANGCNVDITIPGNTCWDAVKIVSMPKDEVAAREQHQHYWLGKWEKEWAAK